MWSVELGKGWRHDFEIARTICASLTTAIKQATYNRFSQTILKYGINDTIEIHEDAPDDWIKFCKDKANTFHDGGKISWLEQLEDVPVAMADWTQYCNDNPGVNRDVLPKEVILPSSVHWRGVGRGSQKRRWWQGWVGG